MNEINHWREARLEQGEGSFHALLETALMLDNATWHTMKYEEPDTFLVLSKRYWDVIRQIQKLAIPFGLMLALAGVAFAQKGEARADHSRFDKSYWSAVAVAGIGTGLDAWTTIDRTHYQRTVNVNGFCNVEGGTPWLYGQKPSATHIAGVMAGEFAIAILSSHLLRKRSAKGRESKAMAALWTVPLAYEGAIHWQGAIRNLENCK